MQSYQQSRPYSSLRDGMDPSSAANRATPRLMCSQLEGVDLQRGSSRYGIGGAGGIVGGAAGSGAGGVS